MAARHPHGLNRLKALLGLAVLCATAVTIGSSGALAQDAEIETAEAAVAQPLGDDEIRQLVDKTSNNGVSVTGVF